jgi:hypothetical protein
MISIFAMNFIDRALCPIARRPAGWPRSHRNHHLLMRSWKRLRNLWIGWTSCYLHCTAGDDDQRLVIYQILVTMHYVHLLLPFLYVSRAA